MTTNAATNLRNLRKSLGMSQTQFASALGLKQGSYSGIEIGVKPISESTKELLRLKFGFITGQTDEPSGSVLTDTIHGRIRQIIDNNYRGVIKEAAVAMGVRPTTLTELMQGKVNPSYDTILKILSCKEFNVTPEWLLKGAGPGDTPSSSTRLDLQIVPALVSNRIKLAPTVCFGHYKGRIYFNQETVKLLGLKDGDWVAFYQSKSQPSHWYFSVERIDGAIALKESKGALFAHSQSVVRKALASMGKEGKSYTYYIEINPVEGKFFRIWPPVNTL